VKPDEKNRTTSRTIRRRGPFVALAVVIAVVGGACSVSPGGGFDIALGGTIPLPTIAAPAAFQGESTFCGDIGYNTPAFNISGATATIPGINVNLGSGTITVPNIQLNFPQINIQLPQLVVCGGTIDLGTASFPATATATGVLDLATSQLTITATVTIPFTIPILGISFPIVIPLSPFTVQL
jgi:hypothetical protein